MSAGEVTVRDYGPGIAEDDLPHVPSDRLHRARSARGCPGRASRSPSSSTSPTRTAASVVAEPAPGPGRVCAVAAPLTHLLTGSQEVVSWPGLMSGHDQITTSPRRGRGRIGSVHAAAPTRRRQPDERASSQDKAFEGALKFSKCSADHGVTSPTHSGSASGGIKITGRTSTPTTQDEVGTERLPEVHADRRGETIDPARRAKLQESALKFARCMRDNTASPCPIRSFRQGAA